MPYAHGFLPPTLHFVSSLIISPNSSAATSLTKVMAVWCVAGGRCGTDAIEFDKVAEVLRRLIQISGPRAQTKMHFQTLRDLLKSYTPANVPMSHVDLHWFASESWNRGVNAYKEQKAAEAEEWMSGAFTFCNLSSSLDWLMEKMGKQYQIVMKACANGSDKSFSTTMSKRVLGIAGMEPTIVPRQQPLMI